MCMTESTDVEPSLPGPAVFVSSGVRVACYPNSLTNSPFEQRN